jgi:phosphatidylinositol alpha 1,6-mannosyltransferase
MTFRADEPVTGAGDGLHAPRAARIALFTGAYNHIADGVSRTLNRLVGHLEASGLDVRVFAPTVASPQVQHVGTLVPVPSIAIPGRPDYRLSLGLTPRLRERLNAFSPDLVHIATPDLLGLQALLYARKRGLPTVASYHTHFASYLQYYRAPILEPVVWKYLSWFYSQCEHVYVPSESMIEVLQEHGLDGNLRLWARGVDIERFNPRARSNSWRRKVGIAENEVVIGFVSRLVLEKGLRRMLDIFEALDKRGVKARVLIVGDGPARRELERSLPTAVFTGYLEGAELARAYASADVFLFPSDTETFGNATLEAMASGLPVVCAEATGNRSLVPHGQSGFRVPVSDVDGFAEALESLVEDHELRARMGAAGFERAQSYSWPRVLDNIIGYYGEILHTSLMPSVSAGRPTISSI